MKKQITLALSAMLFAGTYLRAEETTVNTQVAPTENVVVTSAAPTEAPVAPVAPDATLDASAASAAPTENVDKLPAAPTETPATDVKPAVKKSYVPTFADAKQWCTDHKLVVVGVSAVVGFAILWKTCPAFRAFFGVEDEQEQEPKFVY